MEIPYELLIKYCRSQTSPEENIEIEDWLSKEDHYLLFLDLKKEWLLLDDTSLIMPDKQLVWEGIQAKIEDQRNKQKRVTFFRMMAAASVLFAVVVSSLLYFSPLSKKGQEIVQFTTITTDANEKKEIILSDGTQVWINANSSISYNNKFNIYERQITVDGEFFFDVAPSDKKFIINANKIKIEVLGTSFNLKSHHNEDIEISLKKGKIAVFKTEEEEPLFFLTPSQYVIINKDDLSSNIEIEKNDVSAIWKEKKLQIYDESLDQIVTKLETWYNVNISCAGLDLKKHYTFQLEDESLQDFLEIFSVNNPIQYTIHGKELYIEAVVAD